MSTYSVKAKDIEEKTWYIFDAKDVVLGRAASLIAKTLLGKHKAIYSPHADVGDYVIVINAGELKITGNKAKDKVYYRHSGQIGNLKQITFDKLIDKSAEKLLKITVKGMLPKNTRGRDMLKKLKVYPGLEHPHSAQMPVTLPGE
jgi:large subunit ribosomal protein L13